MQQAGLKPEPTEGKELSTCSRKLSGNISLHLTPKCLIIWVINFIDTYCEL